MFERFTEKARRVIFFARYEASQYGSPYIETEHLLLGLIREDKALTNRLLQGQGGLESIRQEIESRITVRTRTSTSVEIPLSDECKHVLNHTAEEARRLGQRWIDTDHLLLGILREEKSFAAELLNKHNVHIDLGAMREEAAESQSPGPSPVARGGGPWMWVPRSTSDEIPVAGGAGKGGSSEPEKPSAGRSAYERIAGQSVGRLEALSDGIFAVAMTLLVFSLALPAAQTIHSESDLRHALVALSPSLGVYLMSFLMLGIIWVGQQTQLNHLKRSDRDLTWIHLAFLFAVTLLPFSTRLLAEFYRYRAALGIYWANLFLLGLTLYASWGLATRRNLVRGDIPPQVPAAICRRIQIAQGLYALGALLAFFDTRWSIGFIAIVQLNYAFAPRLWRRSARRGRE